MKILIDLDLCQGHSVCMEECPEVFTVEEEPGGYAKVKLRIDKPPDSLRAKVEAAVQYCPTRALSITK